MYKGIIVSLLFIFALLPKQYAQYVVEHFTTDNGLPQNSIKGLHLDHLGFLWIATEDGLCRYNGISFTLYNKSNLPFITQNRFTALHYTEDPKKIYAVNNENIAFKIQDGKIDFSNKINYSNNLNLPLQNEINAKYWTKAYGTAYKKIQAELSSGFLESYSFPYTDTSFSIYGDGYIRLYSKNGRLNNIQLPLGIIPYKFFTLEKKQYFITKNAKLYFVDYTQNSIALLTPTGAYQQLIKTFDLKTFDCFKKWYTKNAYLQNRDLLYRLFLNKSTNKIDLELIANNIPLNNEKVFDITADESKIFFGTTTEGLFLLKKNNFDVFIPKGPLLNEYSYYGLLPYKENSVLTSNGYLFNLNKTYKRPFLTNEERYINKWKDTIYYYKNSAIGKSYKGITKEISIPNWLTKPGAFLNSRQNDFMWITYGKGIAKLKHNNVFEKELTTNLIDSTVAFPTYCLLEDTIHNILYLGTSNALIKYDYKNNTIEQVKELNGKKVRAIRMVSTILFIGTEGDGYFTMYKNKVFKMPLDQKNLMSSVHCFVEDKKQRIWMPTNKGLFMAELNSITNYLNHFNAAHKIYYYYFDKKNGIRNIEFNGGCQPCAALLENEMIALPGIQGITTFNPNTIVTDTTAKVIIFDKVIVDSTITNLENLSFESDLPQYQFFWNTAAWEEERINGFEYHVIGQDTSWKEIEIGYPITLGNLSKGNYTIQIRYLQPNNTYSIQSLSFTIIPKWYQSNLFYAFCFALGILLMYSIFKLYTYRVRRKNIKLEAIVKEKTYALQESNKYLSNEVNIKNKLVSIISHDMVMPLSYIRNVSDDLIQDNSIENQTTKASITAINQSTSGMLLMASNVLNLLNFNTDTIEKNIESINLYDLVQTKLNIYKIASQKKGIPIYNNLDKNCTIISDENLLGLAIQNIINNALKYSFSGEFVVTGKKIGNVLYLSFKDTGIGMSKETIDSITKSEIIISSEQDKYHSSQKLGWKIIVEVVRILHIDFTIESKENEGTIINLLFPC
jgi:signal transduction histidine kinase